MGLEKKMYFMWTAKSIKLKSLINSGCLSLSHWLVTYYPQCIVIWVYGKACIRIDCYIRTFVSVFYLNPSTCTLSLFLCMCTINILTLTISLSCLFITFHVTHFLPNQHPVIWQQDHDHGRFIGQMILKKSHGESGLQDSSAFVGVHVVGGKMKEAGKLGAFISRVKQGSIADTVGQLRAG